MTNGVFVLAKDKTPLMPCHPSRARELLKKGRAAVFRTYPFTIIMKDRDSGDTQPTQIKIDPGSKTTGIAVTAQTAKHGIRVVWGANLTHRGDVIKKNITDRAMYRRSRRSRKTRYRASRFDNRKRATGWLAPSVMHRVHTTVTWTKRLKRYANVTDAFVEEVKFDTQKLRNPGISGKEYQQGKLFGTEMRSYLMMVHKGVCQYCNNASMKFAFEKRQMEWEHIHPKSKGGSDSLSNSTLACRQCNQRKGNSTLDEFARYVTTRLQSKVDGKWASEVLKNIPKVKKNIKPSLKDAAVINAVANAVAKQLTFILDSVEQSPGWITFRNRVDARYTKEHWVDAACVKEAAKIPPWIHGTLITATGHGSRQMVRNDKYGFPAAKPKGNSTIFGFQTGDIVRSEVLKGKYKGTHFGRVVVSSSGSFTIDKTPVRYHTCTLIQRKDGYKYEPFKLQLKM